MKYEKGQPVIVTDYKGRKLLKTVVEDRGNMVFITSEDGYNALIGGDASIWPIGVPRSTVEPAEAACVAN